MANSYFGPVKGKVALITGASAGIGAATAVEFAKLGIRVAIHGRNLDRLKNTKQQCLKQGLKEDDIFLVTGEITSSSDMEKVAKDTLKKFGTLHMLVNNAGGGVIADSKTLPASQMDEQYQQHVKTQLLLTQLFWDELVKNKGTVVNVSSAGAIMAGPGNLAYSVAKAATLHLTKCLSAELSRQGVRVNGVVPGPIRTRFLEASGLAANAEQTAQTFDFLGTITLLGRSAQAVELAKVIVFLSTDASSFIVGQNIIVDGGATNLHAMTAATSAVQDATPASTTEQETAQQEKKQTKGCVIKRNIVNAK